MKSLANSKLLAGGVAVVVLFILYYFFSSFGSSSTPALSVSDTSAVAGGPATDDLLTTLTSLNVIRLDNTIFQDPTFLSLTDFGVAIPPQTPGRRNPFVPASGFTVPSSTPSITLPGATH